MSLPILSQNVSSSSHHRQYMPNRTPHISSSPFYTEPTFPRRNPREKKQSCHSLFLQGPRSTARMAKFTQIARRKRAERPFSAASAIFHPGETLRPFLSPLPTSVSSTFPFTTPYEFDCVITRLCPAIFRPFNHSPLLSCLSPLFVSRPARKQAEFLRRSISDPCKMLLPSSTARLSSNASLKRGKANVRLPKQERSNYRPRK